MMILAQLSLLFTAVKVIQENVSTNHARWPVLNNKGCVNCTSICEYPNYPIYYTMFEIFVEKLNSI